MSRVYASFRVLFIIFSVFSLSGCNGLMQGYVPWGSDTETGYVTNDPNSIPTIAWQTPDQRHVLSEQSSVMTQQQSAGGAVAPHEEAAAAPTPQQPAAPAAAAGTHRKISVSLLVPLSGKKSAIGQSMMKAAQMALFDIGSSNFVLVPRDTKSTKEGAAAAAEAAIKNGDKLILGPVFSEDLTAVRPLAESANTPVISFSTDWTQAGGDTYIMGFLPFTQVIRVVKYAREHGYNRLGVYAPQTEYCDVVVGTLQRSGVPISRISRYSPQQHDLAALVKDFAATSKDASAPNGYSFDMLMLPVGSEGLRTLVTSLDLNGIDQKKVKFIGTGLWDDSILMSTPALFGGWFSAPDPNLRADFENRFRSNYGAQPLRLASLAYDATALAAVLARTAEGDSSPYTREALTHPRGFAGIDGIFRFRPDGLSERGLAVLELQAGKARVIDPAPTAFVASGS